MLKDSVFSSNVLKTSKKVGSEMSLSYGKPALIAATVVALVGAEDLAPARAALISGTYQITASDFLPVLGLGSSPTAPYDPVSFTVKLTFDDSAIYYKATSDLALISSSPEFDFITFTYIPDIRLLSFDFSSADNDIAGGTSIHYSSGFPDGETVYFVDPTSEFSEAYFSTHVSIVFRPAVVNPVPEPGSLTLLGAALLGFGLVRRCRNTGRTAARAA